VSLVSFLFLFCAGVVTGTLGALLGIGGGLFLVPFLVLALNLPMHQAIATSIVAVIATSSAGATMNLERRAVHIRLGMVLEIATVVGAIAGGLTASHLSAAILTKLFSVVLLIVAGLMMRKLLRSGEHERLSTEGVLPSTFHDEATGATIAYAVRRMPALMAVSFIAGNLSGLLGLGGGFFKVPAMTIFGGVPMKAATATSNFMIGVTAAASAFIYFSHGHLNPFIASVTVLGVLSGSYFGIKLNRRIHSSVIAWIFAAVLVIASVQLYFK
jgi:hypothetical protein